jgi:NADPH:quinone reductase-like Zn-dependent oxidoreductase
MRAVMIQKYGGPEVLELAEIPAPHAKEDEVVVEVHASSVNPVDWMVRDGAAKSFVKVSFPVILGCDLAGTVAEVGANVTRFAVGDEVFAMMPQDFGAHAERVALAERLVVAKPKRLGMVAAAAVPVVAMTALLGLRKRGGVQKGERVLVNGASGGVGLSAVQIGKALGAHVTAVCSAPSFELVRRLGADAVIDYKQTDFRRGGETYDLVFDAVGNAPFGECGGVLRGRKIHVTVTPGLGTFVRQLANPLFGVQVFALITRGDGEELAFIKTLIDAGQLEPVVEKVFPLDEVAEAQQYSKTGRAKGKLVLDLRA